MLFQNTLMAMVEREFRGAGCEVTKHPGSYYIVALNSFNQRLSSVLEVTDYHVAMSYVRDFQDAADEDHIAHIVVEKDAVWRQWSRRLTGDWHITTHLSAR